MDIARDLKEIRKEIDSLPDLSDMINGFEMSSSLHEGAYLVNAFDNNLVLKLNLLNSKIKEKKEIKDKFEILCHNLGLLRTASLTRDYSSLKKIVHQFTKNDYTGINAIVDDIQSLKRDTEFLERLYAQLINKLPKSLDLKLCKDFDYNLHIQELNKINEKYKRLFFDIGSLFVKLTRNLLKDKKFRGYINKKSFIE